MMDSAMIGKINKANLYASEPERMAIRDFSVLFTGEHQSYRVGFAEGNWTCECDFFSRRGICSHVMAVERVLKQTGMVLAAPEPVQA
jgi:hypothetical protein